MMRASFLFGFREPVRPRQYLLVGLGLAALKYAGDGVLSLLLAARPLNPIEYLNPFLSARLASIAPYSSWLPALLLIWALPFIWIGVSMSARRALNAGLPPLFSLLFFVPGVNFLVIVLLCQRKEVPGPSERGEPAAGVPRAGDSLGRLRAALIAVAVSAAFGALAAVYSVFLVAQYGTALFLGGPFVLGMISGALYNRPVRQPGDATIAVAVLSFTVAGGVLMLLALEGVMCLGMAAVIGYPLAVLGAVLGRALAFGAKPTAGALSVVAAWPLLALLGAGSSERFPVRAVHTSIEIAAPPERVWPHVVAFPPLPAPQEWLMKSGVACPLSAHIEGRGIGAIRYCEFTTGPFVEPITAWDPPSRLAFDVSSQPPSMREWSPYEVVHAPHLHGGVQSLRGEFRLVRLPGERTRLEGTTWYRVKMEPNAYWSLYADYAIHAIHRRVLDHIRALSE
jgi:hypothetical protein